MLLYIIWSSITTKASFRRISTNCVYIMCIIRNWATLHAQIEKEALAVTWARERCQDYLTGMQFHIEMDHKPLVPLLTSKKRFRRISNSNSEISALSDAIYVFNVPCSREKPFHCRCTFSSTCHWPWPRSSNHSNQTEYSKKRQLPLLAILLVPFLPLKRDQKISVHVWKRMKHVTW